MHSTIFLKKSKLTLNFNITADASVSGINSNV